MTDEFTKKREELAQKLNLSGMHLGKEGPLNNLANVVKALKETPCFAGAFGYDELRQDAVMLRSTPLGAAGPVKDREVLAIAEWCQGQKFNASPNVVRDGLSLVAMEKSFHPVADYLDGLEWDGTPRIEEWLGGYAGAVLDDYTRAVGPKWLVGGVARAMQPGCKVDTMLTLEGDQGIGKSTLFGVLGGEWFSDQISSFGSKDSSMEATRWWVIEVAEMDALSRSETSAIKAFMSRQVERFRLPYGRVISDNPRSCVFGGTLNKTGGYLKDPSGARRFWPVEIKEKICIESLAKDRDQLWAEAVVWYRDSKKHWLTPEEDMRAREEQEDRFDVDAWETSICTIVSGWYVSFKKKEKSLTEDGGLTLEEFNSALSGHEITIERIAKNILEIDLADIDRPTQTRIGNIMHRLGFAKRRLRRTDGLPYVYRKISNEK